MHVDQCLPTRNKAVTGWCCAGICLYYNYGHYLVLQGLKATTTLSFSESSATHCIVWMNYNIPEDALSDSCCYVWQSECCGRWEEMGVVETICVWGTRHFAWFEACSTWKCWKFWIWDIHQSGDNFSTHAFHMLCLWHKSNFVQMCIFFLEVFNLSQLTFTVSSYPSWRKRGRWECNQVGFCLNWQTPHHPLWRRDVLKKFRKLNPPLILLTAKQWKGDKWLKSSSNCWQESIGKVAIYKGFGGWCCRERGCKKVGVKCRVWP